MSQPKDQHTVGTPPKPRGQQTGFAGHLDRNREEMEETPAVGGNRKSANNMAADPSQQHIGSDATKPATNSPSVPAMNQRGRGGQGGEGVFKRRLAKKRAS